MSDKNKFLYNFSYSQLWKITVYLMIILGKIKNNL